MFYEYMWQKFSMTGSVQDYLIFRETEDEKEGFDEEFAAHEPLMV